MRTIPYYIKNPIDIYLPSDLGVSFRIQNDQNIAKRLLKKAALTRVLVVVIVCATCTMPWPKTFISIALHICFLSHFSQINLFNVFFSPALAVFHFRRVFDCVEGIFHN